MYIYITILSIVNILLMIYFLYYTLCIFYGHTNKKNLSPHSSKLAVIVNSKLCKVCINIYLSNFRLF